ncbi:MFS transporter [Streptomyces flaveolus]|uniref:MFS transporter n=1 Tax=Streptomyces flaveolus TaxID=67297 RepID=UPI0034482A3E
MCPDRVVGTVVGRSGIASGIAPLVLVGFGLGALAGSLVGGRLGDHRPHTVTIVAAAGAALLLLAISLLAGYAVPTIMLVTLLGFFGLGANPVLMALAVRFAKQAPVLASALTVSAFNLGTAIGSWIAGLTLDSSLGTTGPAIVGTVIAALTLIPTAPSRSSSAAARQQPLPRPPRTAHTPAAGGVAIAVAGDKTIHELTTHLLPHPPARVVGVAVAGPCPHRPGWRRTTPRAWGVELVPPTNPTCHPRRAEAVPWNRASVRHHRPSRLSPHRSNMRFTPWNVAKQLVEELLARRLARCESVQTHSWSPRLHVSARSAASTAARPSCRSLTK